MKMEKRALLAFVASIGLFLVYDALYLSPRVEKQRQQRAAEQAAQQLVTEDTLLSTGRDGELRPAGTTGQGAADREIPREASAQGSYEETAQQNDAPPAGLPTIDRLAAAEFTIASPLYEVRLSTAGAEIVSFRLLEYETEGEKVELVPQDAGWSDKRMMNLSLDGRVESTPLDGVKFSAYRDGIGDALQSGSTITVDAPGGRTEIVFRAATGSGEIERYYRFYADRYDFETGVRYSAAHFPAVTGVTWGFGPGLWSTEANVRDDQQNFKAAVKLGEDIRRMKPGDFGKKSEEEVSGTLAWASIQTKYFITAIIPAEPTRSAVTIFGDKENSRISQRVTLPAVIERGSVDSSIRVYMGPIHPDTIKPLGVGLDANIEMGWSLIRPVAWAVLWALTWLYQFIPNYGLVIIIISVLTKVLFYRLTHKSFKSMKDMQDLQPRIQALKEKFGDDRQKLSQETMKLYKEAGVNPLGGCLPLLLQMPVFIALFNALRFTIELRQAPFAGWITDLSQQDVLFALPFTLPVIGNAFSLLPLLMGAAMFLQTKFGGSLTGSPGSQTTPQGINTLMPIVFTFLFYKMPSGLVIYWIVNTVLSVAQQYYINKQPQEIKGEAAKSSGTAKKRRPKSKGR